MSQVVLILTGIVVGGLFILVVTAPQERINLESLAKIEEGMSLGEVKAIIGAPPAAFFPVTADGEDDPSKYRGEWRGDDGMQIIIQFNANERVVTKGHIWQKTDPSVIRAWLRKLRRCLGL